MGAERIAQIRERHRATTSGDRDWRLAGDLCFQVHEDIPWLLEKLDEANASVRALREEIENVAACQCACRSCQDVLDGALEWTGCAHAYEDRDAERQWLLDELEAATKRAEAVEKQMQRLLNELGHTVHSAATYYGGKSPWKLCDRCGEIVLVEQRCDCAG